MTTETFEQLFNESLTQFDIAPGSIVKGKVIRIDDDNVIINAGLKSEGTISREEFIGDDKQLEVSVGDMVDVALDAFEDGFGETLLSREKAKRAEAWIDLAKAHEEKRTVVGMITGKVKGGFTAELGVIRAFLPGSLVDVRPVRDPGYLEGKELEFKVIKIDRKRNNVVVSRRAVVEEEGGAEREALLENLKEGQEVKGIIKNLTDYGAFVDLGGVDGLLHITDMSWKRIKHPNEVVTVGDEILVMVLKLDKDSSRVSLGLKQLGHDPWQDIAARYPSESRLFGKVSNITDYGCFVEIETGVEGLVHSSEMDWTNKNVNPKKIVHLGDEVEVMVLEIDEDRRRISLGMKQCQANPWDAFASTHNTGDKIKGAIKSITDFGIFIGLDGEIDGLVHLSDVSWQKAGEEAVHDFKKGQEIEAVILAIDSDRERISLGIKQLEDNPMGKAHEAYPKGKIVTGTVESVEASHAIVTLDDDVKAYLKANDFSVDKIDDLTQHVKVGDSVEGKIMGMDKKTQHFAFSVKAHEMAEQKAAMATQKREAETAGKTTLGDLFKEKGSD